MMIRAQALAVTLAASLALLPAWSAMAQDQRDGRWHGEITPYFWAVGIEGDATVGGRDVDLDVSFDDILDETEAGGSVLGILRKNQLVFYGQIDYLDLSTDVKSPGGITGNLDSTTTIGTLAVGWEFGGWKQGQTIDVLIGARQLSLDNELSLDGVAETFQKDQDFTDTVLVVRPDLPLSNHWNFNGTVSYGSGDSDSTWELWPQFQYTDGENWAARIGYRRLHYDVEGDRGNTFDAAFHGLTLGFGYLF